MLGEAGLVDQDNDIPEDVREARIIDQYDDLPVDVREAGLVEQGGQGKHASQLFKKQKSYFLLEA